ncbi:ArdC family protein [Moritella viscosa]|uniref:ArdC family protein n=1 Tax=Moritella viscosa TaxID=80854 RepID=UPI00091FC1C6|nr:zincin-like metallopeptidase domain-containing protein [Moritella viscosa]SGZ09430.1 Antirestriction protein [Moritella viscosa]
MSDSQNKTASLTNKSSSTQGLEKAQKNPISSKTKVKKSKAKNKAKKTVVDIYQMVTDKIIHALDNGVKPWACPWDRTQEFGQLPLNFKTQNHYSGINILLLWSETVDKGYSSPYWLTFNQVKEMGGNVIKGNKSTQLVFYKPWERENAEGETEIIPMLKPFNVFNLDQIEGIEKPAVKPNIALVEKSGFVENKNAENVISGTGIKIHHSGNQAFYRPSTDEITMPPKELFNHSDNYYSTILHEITHATGHKKRLDRSMAGRFGSSDYAFEELIAELGSAFSCAELGIFGNGETQHACYIASWLKKLNEDKKFIFQAAASAAKAHRWIFKVEINNGKEVKKVA